MKALLIALLFTPPASAETLPELLEKFANRRIEAPRTVQGVPAGNRDRHGDRDEARYRRSGREAALNICARIVFSDEKQACIDTVTRAQHFDEEAVGACAGMRFMDSPAKCLGVIADKEYIGAEIRACKSPFEDDYIDCLARTGRAYARRPRWERRPDLDSYILNRLRRIRQELDAGNTIRALAYLTELLSFVEEGTEGRP